MPVKEIPVPTGEDVQEAQEEATEDIPEESIPEFVPESKADKEEDNWTKVVPKRKARAKAKEEPPKPDLRQRMPCPICKKMYTLHSLLYTHQCTKDARDAKQKKSTQIIEKPTPVPEPEIIEDHVVPPLVKQPVQMSYREALLERRFANEARQREIPTTPILNYYRRV